MGLFFACFGACFGARVRGVQVRPFATRLEELRGMLSEVTDLTTLSQGASLATGVELLSSLFTDSDPEVRAKALEAYVRRVYRAHTMTAVEVIERESDAA